MSESFMSRRGLQIVVVLLGALFFFGFRLWDRDLLRSAEGRVARVAQEMLDTGDWVVPHLNGEPRLEKPPLSSWLVAGLTRLTGAEKVGAAHAYAQSVGAALLTLLLVFFWAFRRRRGTTDEKTLIALWSALVFVSIPLVLQHTRTGKMEALLSLTVAAAFFAAEGRHRALRSREGGRFAGFGSLLVFYLALSASVLIKGHLGLLQVLPALWLWLYMESGRTGREARSRSPVWRRKTKGKKAIGEEAALPPSPPPRATVLPHLVGLILFLLPLLAWGVPFVRQSGYDWASFVAEIKQRFAVAGGAVHHGKPPYFYLVSFPVWMLPWSLLLPWVVWYGRLERPDRLGQAAAKEKKDKGAERAEATVETATAEEIEAAAEDAARRRLWWGWFLWSLVMFSVPRAKQSHYLLPAFTPLALLTGETIAAFTAGRRRPGENIGRWTRSEWRRSFWVMLVVMTGLSLAAAFFVGWGVLFARPKEPVPLVWPWVLVGAAGWGAALFFLWTKLRPAESETARAGFGTVREIYGDIDGEDDVAGRRDEEEREEDSAKAGEEEEPPAVRPALRFWAGWAVGMLAAAALYIVTQEAAYNERTSAAAFCAEVREKVPADATLYDWNTAFGKHTARAAVLFYLGRNVVRADAKTATLFREGREPLYALINGNLRKRLAESGGLPPACYKVLVAVKRFTGKKYGAFLIRGRPKNTAGE